MDRLKFVKRDFSETLELLCFAKGGEFVYNEFVKPITGDTDDQFLDVMDVLLAVFNKVCKEAFSDVIEKRKKAYKTVAAFARENSVKLDKSELELAAA